MEKNETKQVNMNGANASEQQQKLTYEQLNDACNQLAQQNRQAIMRVRELEQIVMNKRMDYLFKILENSSMFSEAFLTKCATEIEQAMTIPEQKETKEEGK